MAFDGITIASIKSQLEERILMGRIYKISQPEQDELLITIKNQGKQYRLFLSASASLPLIYLTEVNKPSPLTAPGFCMLLRKHLQNGKIISISQPGLERILTIEMEHLNELGDLCTKTLIVEIMGKHSNIIFCNGEGQIIDSIKHISCAVSSVREVLPGRPYFIPKTQEKLDPLTVTKEIFCQAILAKPVPLSKAIYTSFTGLSPVIGEELCYRASLDSNQTAKSMDFSSILHLYDCFEGLRKEIIEKKFFPVIIYEKGVPVEFSSLPLKQYKDLDIVSYTSISEALEVYYTEKNTLTRIRQKSSDLRKRVQTLLERSGKKYDLQLKQLKDTEKKEKYKVYGELITTYGYNLSPGASSFQAHNYYTDEIITVPLDPKLPPLENAKKYFEKYSKLKRTKEALTKLVIETKEELNHLQSIFAALDFAIHESDLVQIREELAQSGYMKRKGGKEKKKIISKPFHYISSDGYHMYVGKNNYQNEEITFQMATGNDWWFHAKGCPGSHVIVKANNEEPPIETFEEAGRLAAYYSKGREQEKVEIDYVQRKHVKKPKGGKPGFVVYYTNYSLTIDSDISNIKEVLS